MGNQTPSVGRIIRVMLETGAVRPAIITRVGPVRVDVEDTGQVAYQVFLAPEDCTPATNLFYTWPTHREGRERKSDEAWKAGDWEWPAIVR